MTSRVEKALEAGHLRLTLHPRLALDVDVTAIKMIKHHDRPDGPPKGCWVELRCGVSLHALDDAEELFEQIVARRLDNPCALLRFGLTFRSGRRH